MKTKNKLLAVLLTLCMVMSMASTAFAADAGTISKVSVYANLDYNVGDKPENSVRSISDNAEVKDALWIEYAENGDIAAISAFSSLYAGYTIKEDFRFEEGKTYQFVVAVQAKDGTFADDCTFTINSETCEATNPIPGVYYVYAPKITVKGIPSVDVTVNLSYNVGEKVTFDLLKLDIPDNANYGISQVYIYEQDESGQNVDYISFDVSDLALYTPSDDGAYLYSAGFAASDIHPPREVDVFKADRSYELALLLVPREGYSWACTTANINGHPYELTSYKLRSVFIQMTPTKPGAQDSANELQSTGDIKGSIQFADGIDKNYTLDIKKVDVKKDLANKNVKFIADISVMNGNSVVEIKDNKMTIKLALPEDLKGYNKYEVVYIQNDEIKETLPATVEDGYIVFETTHLSQYGIVATNTSASGNGNQSTTSPKTGDESSLVLWLALLLLSGGGAIATTVVSRKRKYNR